MNEKIVTNFNFVPKETTTLPRGAAGKSNICTCGKSFTMIHRASYMYKIRTTYYCSWTCYQKAKEQNANVNKK